LLLIEVNKKAPLGGLHYYLLPDHASASI